MIGYTRTNVSVLAFVLSVFAMIIIHLLLIQIESQIQSTKYEHVSLEIGASNIEDMNINTIEDVLENTKEETQLETQKKDFSVQNIWQIEIPAINLTAPIAEGATKEIMDNYVGHFTGTSIWEGNIALAAHNRGYNVNYFKDLKNLKQGDKVIYYTKYGYKEYEIFSIEKIKDTDWSYLESTKENIITLITCVEDEPAYRRCIQGIEKI